MWRKRRTWPLAWEAASNHTTWSATRLYQVLEIFQAIDDKGLDLGFTLTTIFGWHFLSFLWNFFNADYFQLETGILSVKFSPGWSCKISSNQLKSAQKHFQIYHWSCLVELYPMVFNNIKPTARLANYTRIEKVGDGTYYVANLQFEQHTVSNEHCRHLFRYKNETILFSLSVYLPY